jgi:hypothetical protein
VLCTRAATADELRAYLAYAWRSHDAGKNRVRQVDPQNGTDAWGSSDATPETCEMGRVGIGDRARIVDLDVEVGLAGVEDLLGHLRDGIRSQNQRAYHRGVELGPHDVDVISVKHATSRPLDRGHDRIPRSASRSTTVAIDVERGAGDRRISMPWRATACIRGREAPLGKRYARGARRIGRAVARVKGRFVLVGHVVARREYDDDRDGPRPDASSHVRHSKVFRELLVHPRGLPAPPRPLSSSEEFLVA